MGRKFPEMRRTPLRQESCELPRDLGKDIARFALNLKRDHISLFASNPSLRKRVGQFLTALLPPKPKRRGRPGIPSVTRAIQLRKELHRQFRKEPWPKIWERIYPEVIPGYADLSDHEKKRAREVLRERVRWRLKIKKTRRSLRPPGNIPA
jgi:hypothetical protein